MPLPKKVRYFPRGVTRGAAMALLMDEYKADPDFAKERDTVFQQYSSILPQVQSYLLEKLKERGVHIPDEGTTLSGIEAAGQTAAALREITDSAGVENGLFQEMGEDFLHRVPLARYYLQAYIDLCSDSGLEYDWAPEFLFSEDMARYLNLGTDDMRVVVSIQLSSMFGIPPFIALVLPLSVVYLQSREEIHKLVDSILDEIPRDPSWRDLPHALPIHVKWLYAHKAKGMSYLQIYQDQSLNPYGSSQEGGSEKIGRAVRKLRGILAGSPSPGSSDKTE